MLRTSNSHFFTALSLGAMLLCASPVALMAKEQLLILFIVKASAKAPAAKITANADGAFSVKGLEPGTYKVCLENGTGCVETDVGEEGFIRGVAKTDASQAAGKKHNYVGHVTLLR